VLNIKFLVNNFQKTASHRNSSVLSCRSFECKPETILIFSASLAQKTFWRAEMPPCRWLIKFGRPPQLSVCRPPVPNSSGPPYKGLRPRSFLKTPFPSPLLHSVNQGMEDYGPHARHERTRKCPKNQTSFEHIC
jgi:hypothetical protein